MEDGNSIKSRPAATAASAELFVAFTRDQVVINRRIGRMGPVAFAQVFRPSLVSFFLGNGRVTVKLMKEALEGQEVVGRRGRCARACCA